jgi:hypothetical protein
MRTQKTGTLTAALGTVVLGLQDAISFVSLSGTYTGGQVVIEGTVDNTTWVPVEAYSSDTNYPVYDTITLATNATKGYHVPSSGFLQLRVKCVAISTGSIAVVVANGPGKLPSVDQGKLNLVADNVANKVGSVTAGSGAADVVVVAGSGVLHRLIVTTAGTAALSVYDHATATAGQSPLFTSGTTYALGTVTELNIPFANGLVFLQASGSAAVSVGYSLS